MKLNFHQNCKILPNLVTLEMTRNESVKQIFRKDAEKHKKYFIFRSRKHSNRRRRHDVVKN